MSATKDSRVNPYTGRRYGWEKEQSARKQADTEARKAKAEADREIAAAERILLSRKAREDLLTFTNFTMPDTEDPGNIKKSRYKAARFHKMTAKTISDFLQGKLLHEDGRVCTQLIFCMPPRHGKTEMATKRAAAFYSGNNPAHDVIVASASDILANDIGADVRTIIQTPQFKQIFPTHKLMRGGGAKDNLQTSEGGRLIFAGRGGTINGRGAHLLLVDDLYKDDEEARSQAVRDQAWNWFNRVALMRRMGKRLTIVTMTRWHSDDIIGRLTDPKNELYYNEEEARNWMIIRLPGLAEEGDPLGREPGEALWPERYDTDYHHANRRRDPLGFAALTQQRPTVADGVLFRRENIMWYTADTLPKDLRVYCASDHAIGLGQRNDYTVLLKIGIDRQNNMYVLDRVRRKVSADIAVELMLQMATKDPKPLLWWAERGHISKSIGPFLRTNMRNTNRFLNIVEVTPAADKVTRAQSIIAMVGAGMVLFPRHLPWGAELVEELLEFPSGVHDDQVDALAYLGLGLQFQFGPGKLVAKNDDKHPKTGTVAWLKQMDRWQDDQKRRLANGGF